MSVLPHLDRRIGLHRLNQVVDLVVHAIIDGIDGRILILVRASFMLAPSTASDRSTSEISLRFLRPFDDPVAVGTLQWLLSAGAAKQRHRRALSRRFWPLEAAETRADGGLISSPSSWTYPH